MDRKALVCLDLAGAPHLVGRLWARARKNKETATFEYDQGWLQQAARFSLEPALTLGPGPFHRLAFLRAEGHPCRRKQQYGA